MAESFLPIDFDTGVAYGASAAFISPAVKGTIQGLGRHSYLMGLRALAALAQEAR